MLIQLHSLDQQLLLTDEEICPFGPFLGRFRPFFSYFQAFSWRLRGVGFPTINWENHQKMAIFGGPISELNIYG